MAKTLETFDFQTRGTRYPWSDWTNGKIWEVKQGQDFTVKLQSFRSVLKIHATRNGFELKTGSPEEGVLVFQFIKK